MVISKIISTPKQKSNRKQIFEKKGPQGEK